MVKEKIYQKKKVQSQDTDMNIPIPKNMKSPTVIIVGQQETEKKNDITLKRMDNLERKLDQQYKSFIDKTDYAKVIGNMQSSFMNNFNKMFSMNKSMMTQTHSQRIDLLRKEFENKIKGLKESKDNDGYLRSFTKQLNSLEESIKNITLKPTVVRVPNNNKTLFNSFNDILHKMELMIQDSKPRMYPSPS